jgi:hypothetical protein
MIAKTIVLCAAMLSGVALAARPPAPPAKAAAAKAPPLEKLSCRTGPNDHQARLIVEVVKGRAMEFAYYSRLGTRVCSVHGRRGDGFTKWEDDGSKARVQLIEGFALLEYEPGNFKITFVDVGRMVYCGMVGELNGTVEVTKRKTECGVNGVFD